jgi:Beta protein
MNISEAIYMPQLKWKSGELRAVGTARGGRSGRLLPLFIVPPSGAFDHMEGRTLGTAEYLKSFGAKLAANWQGGPVFVDALHIDDEKHSSAVGQHALTELLERARLAHVVACPVTSLSRSKSYQEAVRRFRAHNPGWPICIRLSLSELDILANKERLSSFLNQFGAVARETVLLIDAGPIYIPDVDQLSNIIIEALAPLGTGDAFAKVFWASTTFPEKHDLKAGQTGVWARSDWQVYKRLTERSAELPITPLFSDYALEYPAYYKPVQAPPVAHLRYSSDDSYFMVRGLSTKKPNGYEAIFDVADRLVTHPEFLGSDYSLGNSYMAGLTKSGASTGNASLWRWASTDHHLTVVLQAMGRLLRLPIQVEEVETRADQFELI